MCIRDRGNLSVEYNHRVVIFKDLDKTKTYDGGYLNFSGDIGLYFEFKPVSYTHLDVYKRQPQQHLLI